MLLETIIVQKYKWPGQEKGTELFVPFRNPVREGEISPGGLEHMSEQDISSCSCFPPGGSVYASWAGDLGIPPNLHTLPFGGFAVQAGAISFHGCTSQHSPVNCGPDSLQSYLLCSHLHLGVPSEASSILHFLCTGISDITELCRAVMNQAL